MTDKPPVPVVDASGEDFVLNPAKHYAELRAACPISWQPGSHAWLIARHDDAAAALRNPDLAHVGILRTWLSLRERHGLEFPFSIKVISAMPFNYEGEAHTEMRRTFAKSVAPFADRRDRFKSCVDRLLARGLRTGGFDFAEDFANRLLFQILCDLSNIDEADQPALYPMSRLSWAADATISVRERTTMEGSLSRVFDLLRDKVPAILERSPDGLLSSMYRSLPDDEADKIEATIVNLCVMLMMGNDAMGGCFCFGVQWLLDEKRNGGKTVPQDRWGELSDDILRFGASVDFLSRSAVTQSSVGDVKLAPGDWVMVSPLSANHDSAKHGPGAESIGLENRQGTGLTFGAGRHLCIGMQMSRNIAKVVAQALADLPPLALDGPSVQARGKIIRTLETMPVRLA